MSLQTTYLQQLDQHLEETLTSYFYDKPTTRNTHGIIPWLTIKKRLNAVYPKILRLHELKHHTRLLFPEEKTC